MEVIEHNKNLRMLFESMVDDLLEKYHLSLHTEKEYVHRATIFDD